MKLDNAPASKNGYSEININCLQELFAYNDTTISSTCWAISHLNSIVNPVEAERFPYYANIDARYNANYCIERDELQWLSDKVQALLQMTDEMCRKKIGSFGPKDI